MKHNHTTSDGHFALAILFFALSVGFAFLLLFGAGIAWLSLLIGSPIVALCIVGCFSALLAGVIYLVGLRKRWAQMHEDLRVLFEMGHTLRKNYLWMSVKIDQIKLLYAHFFRKDSKE